MSRNNRPLSNPNKTLVGTVSVVITAGVVIAALMYGRSEQTENDSSSQNQSKSDGPGQCVQSMLESAQEGDIESYFACFANDLQDALKKKSATQSTAQFAAELRRREADLKNFVVNDLEFPTAGVATLELERMYSDHNTRHRVRLKRINGEWKIVELVPLEQYAPEIPFGTPVVPGLDGRPK
jgi:hypothetical protein